MSQGNPLTFDHKMDRLRMMAWTEYASDGSYWKLYTAIHDAGSLDNLEKHTSMFTSITGPQVHAKSMKVGGKLIITVTLYVYT